MDLISTWIPWSDGCSGITRAWRWVRILAPLYLLGCLVMLWDVCGGFGYVAPEVKVPSLRRLSVSTATERLQQLGIGVLLVDGDRSDGYSAGMVMEQSIPAGVHVRAGRRIYLVVCKGPLHVKIPDLRSSSSTDALKALVDLDLHPLIVASTTSDNIPFDCIVSETPPPSTRVEVGTPVALVVSDGPASSGFDDSGVDTGLPGSGYPGSGYPGSGYPGGTDSTGNYAADNYSADSYSMDGYPGVDPGMDNYSGATAGQPASPRRRSLATAPPRQSRAASPGASPEWESSTAPPADSTAVGDGAAQFGDATPPPRPADGGLFPYEPASRVAIPPIPPPAGPAAAVPSSARVIVRTNLRAAP